jgi:predicted flap endonuclease-1-like 5' DNA nuclease
MKDLGASHGPGSDVPAVACVGLAASAGPLSEYLILPNVLLALVVAATLGGWLGWTIRSGRARTRRRAEEAWESERIRAAGCARDRAIEEKEQLEVRLERLQQEHATCESRLEGLAKKLRSRDASLETMKTDLASALEANEERGHRIHSLERSVADLESSLEERDAIDGTPSWLMQAPDGEGDDLTALRGLGPVLEKRLNEIGVCSYRQLAQMTEQDAQWIATRIQVVPGRILRDRWAEQARKAHLEKYGEPI